jgi:hypothetical protein
MCGMNANVQRFVAALAVFVGLLGTGFVIEVEASAAAAPPAPVPDIIGTCPTRPITSPGAHAHVLRSAKRAAAGYAMTVLHWPAVEITSAYRVGSKGGAGYESLYRYQITKSCGRATARSTYGVDISNPLGDSSTSSRATMVVAHFADGWHVWARYYN